MPKQGNTVESCIIVEWNVDVGDKVGWETFSPAETDKSTIDVESTAAGWSSPASGRKAMMFRHGADSHRRKEGESFEIQQPGKEETSVRAERACNSSGRAKDERSGKQRTCRRRFDSRARMLSEQLGVPLAQRLDRPKGRIVEKDVRALAGAPCLRRRKRRPSRKGSFLLRLAAEWADGCLPVI